MFFLKLFQKNRGSDRDCRNCTDPDCPASPVNLKDYPIRVAREDLYDLSGNLIENLIPQPAECAKDKKTREKLKSPPRSRSFKKELKLLRSEVRGLSEELSAHLERGRDLERAETDLGRSLTEIRSEVNALEESLAGFGFSEDDGRAVREFLHKVESISDMIAGADEVDELRKRLDQADERAADRESLEELRKEIETLRQAMAGREDLAEISARLEDELAKTTERETVKELRKEIEELRRATAGRTEQDELSARLALIESLPRAHAVDEIFSALEDLQKRMPSRQEVEELSSRLELLSAAAADRADLDRACADIRDLKKSAARKENLEILSCELDDLSGRAADGKELEEVRSALENLRQTAATREDKEALDKELAELRRISAAGEDLDKTALELAELKASAASSEEAKALSERLSRLEHSAAPKAALEHAVSRLDKLEEFSADRKELNESIKRIYELESTRASKERVEGLAKICEDLDAAGNRSTEDIARVEKELHKRLHVLSNEVKSQSSLKADRQDMDALLDKARELSAKKANHQDLLSLAEKVREVIRHSAGKEDLASVDRELKDSLRKTAGSLAEMRSQLDSARAESASRESLIELAERIDELVARLDSEERSSAHVSRDKEKRLSEASASLDLRLKELESEKIGREELNSFGKELNDSIRETAASLSELREYITKEREGSVAKEEFTELAEKIDAVTLRLESGDGNAEGSSREEEILDRVSAFLNRRLDEFDSKKAGRDELEEISSKVDEHGELEKDRLSHLCSRIDELQSQLSDRAAEDGKEAVSTEASRQLAEVARNFSELEQGVQDLQNFGAGADATGCFEDRLGKMREELASSRSEAGGEEDSEPLQRVRYLEAQHKELRRQIRKAFENLTNYPLRELDELKKKVEVIEQKQVSPPQPRPRPAVYPPQPGPKKNKRTGRLAAAAMAVLLAGLLGVALAWKWTGASESTPEENHAKPAETELGYIPNMVYDNLAPALSAPTLYMSEEKVKLEQGKAGISGHAPGAVQAFLYINNEKRASAPVRGKFFDFGKVFLEYGVNVVEVKVIDGEGNEASSMAAVLERMSGTAARVERTGIINRMRGPAYLPHLALTVDGGGSNHRAKELLDVLEQKGIITTFFLTGRFIEKYPETVKRIVADGHEVGNHTYSHPHLTTFHKNRRHTTSRGVDREFVRKQLTKTERIFEDLTGVDMVPWWRAPYGERNKEVLAWAEEAGYKHIDWTRSPVNYDMLDWVAEPSSRFYLDSKGLYSRFTSIDGGKTGGANGGIILVHLGSDRDKHYLDQVLPRAIEELRSRGYKFVTVSRMFND